MDHDDRLRSTPRQPWLHELAVCVNGNATALGGSDGQIEGLGAAPDPRGRAVPDRTAMQA